MFPTRRITLGGDVFRDEYSLSFDGTDEYIAVSNNSSIQFDDDALTISVWIKAGALENDWNRILGKGDLSSGTQSYELMQINTDGILRFQLEDASSSRAETSTTLVNNIWYHIVCTYDKIKTKIYVNGALDGESSYTADVGINTENLYIGTGASLGNCFEGKVSDLSMYNCALSASQIKTIYNGREPYNHKKGVASSNLVGWWRMGDGVLDSFNLIGDEVNATLGSNLVTNGGFDTDSDWTKGADWSIDTTDGVAKGDSTTDNLIQSGIVEVGKHYKITYTIKDYVSGSVRVELSTDTSAGVTRSSNGTFTETLKANSTYIAFDARSSFTGSIDNVKVYEVNGNSGIMMNMSADDFTGDTP